MTEDVSITWEDSERLLGLAALCSTSLLFCSRKLVDRLGFSAAFINIVIKDFFLSVFGFV